MGAGHPIQCIDKGRYHASFEHGCRDLVDRLIPRIKAV